MPLTRAEVAALVYSGLAVAEGDIPAGALVQVEAAIDRIAAKGEDGEALADTLGLVWPPNDALLAVAEAAGRARVAVAERNHRVRQALQDGYSVRVVADAAGMSSSWPLTVRQSDEKGTESA